MSIVTARTPRGASARRAALPLEKALGYRFANAALLEVALTHASMRSLNDKPANSKRTDAKSKAPAARAKAAKDSQTANPVGAAARQQTSGQDNERLEFLGDRVLGLAIAEMLTAAFPLAEEGELARRYNRLVRREACAEVALALELGRHLVLSEGEDESGGRAKLTILADACEALLGAIFLDGGFEPSRAVVQRLWKPLLDKDERDRPDPKSALQEWAQGLGMAIPLYAVTGRQGPDHAPHFTAEVRIAGRKPATGQGTSKRLAEQAAATAFLLQERVWQESGDGDRQ